MAIYVPGKRDPRHKNRIVIARRSVVTGLSLTSMVDMFTILEWLLANEHLWEYLKFPLWMNNFAKGKQQEW
jgi:hypothetical protein